MKVNDGIMVISCPVGKELGVTLQCIYGFIQVVHMIIRIDSFYLHIGFFFSLPVTHIFRKFLLHQIVGSINRKKWNLSESS